MTYVFIVWVGVMLGLLATPRGRATLARWLADTRRVLGFDRGDMGRRWHELAAAEDARDPALRRCAAVKAAYLAGEFGPDELDWRILLALQPPPPARRRRLLGVGPWSEFEEGPHCAFRDLHSGSGYIGSVCDCGHDVKMHYNGGCNDCDAFNRGMEPLPTEPDPRLVSYGEHLGHRPPKPSDSARSVRPASRQSHG